MSRPARQRNRASALLAVTITAIALTVTLCPGCKPAASDTTKKVVVMGFDGMEPALLRLLFVTTLPGNSAQKSFAAPGSNMCRPH